ncbi:hypothetical protein AB8O64_36055 (plasmid) [Streptomyces sp. QH1-20]|uniref:NADase-type glycan-binding domain-containing protein n=1 Tax=Streptomyces sp. QH1-20 TaxID=3240934 RepID=UPI0035184001
MGTASSGHQGWHVPGEQDVCHGCGVVAYPGEMFCVPCGAYLGWDRTGSNPVVPLRPGPAAAASSADSGRSTASGGQAYGVADSGRSAAAGGAGYGGGASVPGGSGYASAEAPGAHGPVYDGAAAQQPAFGGPADTGSRGARDWDIRALYPEAQQGPSAAGHAGTNYGNTASAHPAPGAPAAGTWGSTTAYSSHSAFSSGRRRNGSGFPDGSRAEPVWPQGLSAYPGRPTPGLYAAPPAAEPAAGQPQFATPGEAGLYAPADIPYTSAAQTAPAAAQTQVIDGEVVLWATLPEGPAAPSASVAPSPPEGVPHMLLCPECEAPNAKSRTYCQPCGALMRPEPEPPELTRWEQFRNDYLERPRVWHWDHRWSMALATLPVCLAAGMSMGGVAAVAERTVPLVKDRFATQYAVSPRSVSATSSAKGFDPQFAHDGVDNKAWAPQGTGDAAVGQAWTATFQNPFRLTALSLINGAAKSAEQFFESGRPTKITVVANTTDQGPVKKQLTLGGQPGPQRYDLGIDNVVSVQIRIDAVATGSNADAPVAMAEIQFFSRQTS